jgi:hypothetical protein
VAEVTLSEEDTRHVSIDGWSPEHAKAARHRFGTDDGGFVRFFTRAWHGGEMSDAEAERVVSMYEAHLAALGPRLPGDARRLQTEVSLHDALLRGVEGAADGFEVSFRAGEEGTGYFDARLSYDHAQLSPADEQFLRTAVGRRDVELLYDEFDGADAQWVHRFLFWPYHEVSVHFGAFRLVVTPAPGRFDTDQAETNAPMTGDEPRD